MSKDEKENLFSAGTLTIERESVYLDHNGDISKETKVYFLSETSRGWKPVGYGTATLTGHSPDGKNVYQITLKETVPAQ